MMALVTKKQRRRYYLHHRLKKHKGWKVDARNRVIRKNVLNASAQKPKYAEQLQEEYNYSIQLSI